MATTPQSVPPTVQQQPCCTWRPTTGGILSIIAGAGNLMFGFFALALKELWEQLGAGSAFRMEAIGGLGAIWIILGILAIIGGILALRRKAWVLALVGAICAMIWPTSLLGILALIFIAISRKEFV